jgi:hypothetical protein
MISARDGAHTTLELEQRAQERLQARDSIVPRRRARRTDRHP